MDKSESIKEIAGALAKFQAEVSNVIKDATNQFFKSNYASLENVINTAKPILEKQGLSFAQFPSHVRVYGATNETTQPALTTIIMHTSGEWLCDTAPLELKGHTPQEQGSAITYMRRYALSAALGLATEDDDDGNAASKPVMVTKVAPSPLKAADAKVNQKKEIKDLCDGLVGEVGAPLKTKEDYERYVLDNTGLKLGVDDNAEIIKRLKALS